MGRGKRTNDAARPPRLRLSGARYQVGPSVFDSEAHKEAAFFGRWRRTPGGARDASVLFSPHIGELFFCVEELYGVAALEVLAVIEAAGAHDAAGGHLLEQVLLGWELACRSETLDWVRARVADAVTETTTTAHVGPRLRVSALAS